MISWPLINNNAWPIGLDIGHHSINMVQLSGSGTSISVVAAERTRIDPAVNAEPGQRNQFIVSSVKQMLERGTFSGRKAISALVNEKMHVTSLRMNAVDEGELEQVLRNEAKARFGIEGLNDSVNYLNVGQVTQGEEVKNELILFASNENSIREHILLIENCGLEPASIEPIPCALFRSLTRSMRRHEDRDQTMVFIDVGGRFTTVVFGKAGQINFIKEIPIGADRFDEHIAEKLGVNPQDAEVLRAALRMERYSNQSVKSANAGVLNTAVQQGIDVNTRQTVVDAVGAVAQDLAREILLCFRYYTVTFRGKRVERAVFSGGGAYEDILLNILKRQLTVELDIAEPFRGFDMSRVNMQTDKHSSLCEWAVAVGLALKQALN
ncbi:MAG: pilus assembly protein PilM [Phycisphaerae bacterium]